MSEATLTLQANQAAQYDFLWDQAPGETLYQGGWGAGKSWAGSRKLVMLTMASGTDSLAVAPTYGDLFRFVVPALRDACQHLSVPFIDKSSAQEMPGVQIGAHWCHTMTAEKPQRFAGFEVGQCWIDEGARIRESPDNPLMDAPTQIRSRLRSGDRLHLLVTTTPEGAETWVQRDFIDNPAAFRRAYIGSTRRNAHLPPQYIENIKASVPPELLDQYLEGSAVNYVADRAHPQYTDAVHIQGYTPNEHLPVHLGADFNVSPMTWVLAQEVPGSGRLHVFDEVVIDDGATVDVAMRKATQQGWGKFPVVNLHLDRSAKNRSTVGPAQYDAIMRLARDLGWNVSGNVDGVNPPINARIDNLSTRLMAGDGTVRLLIDPRCEKLRHDLLHTSRGSNGYNPGRDGKLGHILDALGYLCWDLDRKGQVGAVSWFG